MLKYFKTLAVAINIQYAEGKIDYLKYKQMKAKVLDDVDAAILPTVANYFVV